jgi:hypothetical protein
MIDPFIKSHRITENDNPLMDAVVTTFNEIANDTNCAVELVQHARKTGGNDITIDDARGASSIIARRRRPHHQSDDQERRRKDRHRRR